MDVSSEHPARAPSPISVTPSGIFTEVKAVPTNASDPIDMTEDGMFIDERDSQYAKASEPIFVIPSGKVMEVIYEQSENA